jgi:hypothetical protein
MRALVRYSMAARATDKSNVALHRDAEIVNLQDPEFQDISKLTPK